MDREGLSQVIEDLKRRLHEATVKQKYNFQHPDVQQISRTLDTFILEYMKFERKPLKPKISQGKDAFF